MECAPARVDEEAFAGELPSADRRERGVYLTPAPLADFVVDLAARQVRGPRVAVIDPACGAGAFLVAARRRLPRAKLFGLELSASLAGQARERLPEAQIATGDALRKGLDPILERIPSGTFELWVGNPPYNGTSPSLRDAQLYAELRSWLPGALPRGTSLRDDFAFFLLLAARRLERRPGALAFITSTTLLDAFLYAPLRRALLDRLVLREVVELGAGAFRNTRVRTCVTVWTSSGKQRPARAEPVLHRDRSRPGPFAPGQLTSPRAFRPEAPDWLLRPPNDDAAALDAAWRKSGEPLSVAIPVSFPGLKTRFDELLVDDDPAQLLARLAQFLRAPRSGLTAFARHHAIPAHCLPKLIALHAAAREARVELDPASVRPFYRYAGAKHRGFIPETALAFCYLDRRLIPRGDHRFRGDYDPHACPTKLVFNARELPLSAALLEWPGCVHDHRHARFAPLFVPERVWREGPSAARAGGELGPEVPNLSPRARACAEQYGGPLAFFRAVADFINSPEVQEIWAPAFGASRDLHLPAQMYPNRRRSSHSAPSSATSATR